jgi:hypothetical protein
MAPCESITSSVRIINSGNGMATAQNNRSALRCARHPYGRGSESQVGTVRGVLTYSSIMPIGCGRSIPAGSVRATGRSDCTVRFVLVNSKATACPNSRPKRGPPSRLCKKLERVAKEKMPLSPPDGGGSGVKLC